MASLRRQRPYQKRETHSDEGGHSTGEEEPRNGLTSADKHDALGCEWPYGYPPYKP